MMALIPLLFVFWCFGLLANKKMRRHRRDKRLNQYYLNQIGRTSNRRR